MAQSPGHGHTPRKLTSYRLAGQGMAELLDGAMGRREAPQALAVASVVPSQALRTVAAHDGGCFALAFDRCAGAHVRRADPQQHAARGYMGVAHVKADRALMLYLGLAMQACNVPE